jgi:hypothetical protein
MALPDVFLIGAPKAGTTSVATWLAHHPQVYWSIPKEPFYWATDYPRMRQHHGFVTREDYEALFVSPAARAADVRAEGSTNYLYSATAVPSILEAVPHARFIVCVRNPADLLVSWHRTQLVTMNECERDFGRAWRRSLTGALPQTDLLDPKLVDYPMVGGLGTALDRLYRHVDRDRVHVIVLDDLRQQRELVWARLSEFVGIDPGTRPDLEAGRNASDKAYRFRALQHVLLRPPRSLAPAVRGLRQWSRTSRLPGVRSARSVIWRHEERPTASAHDRNAVLDHFESDIELLGRLLDRDLSAWTVRSDETCLGEVGSA